MRSTTCCRRAARNRNISVSGSGTALEEAPHTLPERRAVGLARLLDREALTLQPAREAEHLGRLARPLDALKCNEHSPHGNASGSESRNCSTVSRPGQRASERG